MCFKSIILSVLLCIFAFICVGCPSRGGDGTRTEDQTTSAKQDTTVLEY